MCEYVGFHEFCVYIISSTNLLAKMVWTAGSICMDKSMGLTFVGGGHDMLESPHHALKNPVTGSLPLVLIISSRSMKWSQYGRNCTPEKPRIYITVILITT